MNPVEPKTSYFFIVLILVLSLFALIYLGKVDIDIEALGGSMKIVSK